jgi:TonB family protein
MGNADMHTRTIRMTCILSSLIAFSQPLHAAEGSTGQESAGDAASSNADSKEQDGSARIAPPEILQKVDPVYPAQALAERRTGAVVLQLDIDEAGKVMAAKVVQGAGYGMDEAAEGAAKQLLFTPATRAAQPIRSRILYKMTFDLKVAPQSAELPQDQPSVAPISSIRGVVKLDETDTPCVGALVELRLGDGQTLKATTDSKGAWEFTQIAPGTAVVQVVAPGYETLRSEETLVAGERVEIKYRLHATDGAIEVVVLGKRTDREITRRTVERQELAVIPGTGGDALKSVQSLPGVARTPVFGGMIVVRGSSPYGTQTFIDGTYVPAIYHFGGLSSIVPTEMIESIDFYPGNFSAKYGRATGGIIDVKLREMEYDGKYHGLAQVDFIDARVMLRGPVPLAHGWSFNVGARRSYIDA